MEVGIRNPGRLSALSVSRVFIFGHFLPMNEQNDFVEQRFVWW
jgi:hypothetical protein